LRETRNAVLGEGTFAQRRVLLHPALVNPQPLARAFAHAVFNEARDRGSEQYNIPLDALRYWSVDLQEAYANPAIALLRFQERGFTPG